MMNSPTICLLIFSITVYGQISTQNCSKFTSEPYRCTYYYSTVGSNCTDLLTFTSCQYPVQCTQLTPNGSCLNDTKLISTNYTLCQQKCPSSADPLPNPNEQPNKNGFLLVGIIGIVIILLILCTCTMRICCLRRQASRNYSHEAQIIEIPPESERYFSEWYNTGNEQWIPCRPGDDVVEEICVICLDEKRQAYLRCDHGFHIRCIREWLSLKRNCPTCKNEQIGPIRLICLHCRQLQILISKTQLNLITLPDRCPTCKLQSWPLPPHPTIFMSFVSSLP